MSGFRCRLFTVVVLVVCSVLCDAAPLPLTRATSSIHGVKFLDLDGNGVLDPGEPGLAGVEFTLSGIDELGNIINLSEMTDFNGWFAFTGLLPSVASSPPGTGYTVTETVPTGHVATTPVSFTTDLQADEELVAIAGQAMLPPGDPRVEVVLGASLMFGNTVPGSIHGLKFSDLDGDGVRDPGEPGLAGVEFTLTGIDGQGNVINSSQMTDFNGWFAFTSLLPSLAGIGPATGYTVTETVPIGSIPTTPTSFTSDLGSGEELVAIAGQAMLPPGDPRVEVLVGSPLMFGNTVPGSIHGFKYEDLDCDGVYDPLVDLPLAGVEFTLTGTDGQGNVINTSEMTDINGWFAFTSLLPSIAGSGPATGYTVTETVPAGHVATTPVSFTTDLQSGEELVAFAGQANLPPGDPRVEVVLGASLMFGNTVPGSIHGFKYEDVDGDGVYDPLVDLPLAGVEFTLTGTDGQGNVINTSEMSDASGEFVFTGLLASVSGVGPATGYTITETVPLGYVATTPTSHTTDLLSRQELVALAGQAMLPPPASTTISFDNVDASGGPITGVALDSYLMQLGITITDITPSGLCEIVDDRFGFPSQVLRAFTDFNVFWHDSPNLPYAYTVNFASPQADFSFVRSELFGATPSGLIVSPWRARAFDSSGALLDTVSEPQLAFFGSTPPVTFTLTGPGVAYVIFDRTTLNTIAGLNRVPTDNWVCDVPTDPRREILVGSDLMFGNLLVPPTPPLFSKAFMPPLVPTGGTSTLVFTIDASANSATVGDLDFTDNLPAGMVIAGIPNASTTCGGGSLTAPAAAATISYTGGSVGAASSCTVSVDVTGSTAGTFLNVSGDLTSAEGNSGPATDTLIVGLSSSFACTGEGYLVEDVNSQLNLVEQWFSTYSLQPVGGPSGADLNNLGFRSSDGLFYAVELLPAGNNGLVQIGPGGAVQALGSPAGLPVDQRFNAGDVTPDGGTMYLTVDGEGSIYAVTLPALLVTSIPITGDAGVVADWAVNGQDGLLYGGDSLDGELAMLDPATGVRTDVTLAGLTAGTAFGGAWFDAAGQLFLYREDGAILRVDPVGPALVDTAIGPAVNDTDGAACQQDVLGAAKMMTPTATGLPATVTIDYVFENFSATETLTDLSAVEDLGAVFGAHGVDWTFTSVSSAPAAFANLGFEGHTDTELVNQTPTQSLASGAVATVTVILELYTYANADLNGDFVNRVLVLGDPGGGVLAGDLSTDGTDPDPNGDGVPAESDPSIFNVTDVPVTIVLFTVR